MNTGIQSKYATVNGVRLHYLVAGEGDPLILIHGFPQTSHLWRPIMERFADRFTVIAPDFRGAGRSDRPVGGYDKKTMAEDILQLADHVCPGKPISLAGHDMGAFVAFAMAASRPQQIRRLCLIDAPVLGTPAWDALRQNPRVWHVAFHSAIDAALQLVTGKEKEYVAQFFHARAFDYAAVEEAAEYSGRQYALPGALRAAFSAYAALAEDAEQNKQLLTDFRLPMPLLLIAGELSNSGGILEPMGSEVAVDFEFREFPASGHWIVEEQPDLLVETLARFLD